MDSTERSVGTSGRWRRAGRPGALRPWGHRVQHDGVAQQRCVSGMGAPWQTFKILGILFLSKIGKRKYHIDIAYTSRLSFNT